MTILKMDSVSYQYNSLQENFMLLKGNLVQENQPCFPFLQDLILLQKEKSSLKIKTSLKKAITITDGNKSPWFSKIII